MRFFPCEVRMEYFAEIIDVIITFMKIPFTLWGFTFSLWSVFVWGILASLAIWALMKIFGGGKD